jgi:hypothetical protein
VKRLMFQVVKKKKDEQQIIIRVKLLI